MSARILVPTDFSAASNHAFNQALLLAEQTGATVHVLHVIHLASPDNYLGAVSYLTMRSDSERNARAQFLTLRLEVTARRIKDVHFSVVCGNPAREIRLYARREMIDLVLVGVPGLPDNRSLVQACETAADDAVFSLVRIKEGKSLPVLSNDFTGTISRSEWLCGV